MHVHISDSDNRNVEARDSRTGYLVPVRDGPGALTDVESCWDAVAAAVAVALIWKFRHTKYKFRHPK